MTALTAERDTPRREGQSRVIKVKAGARLYKGGIVAIDGDGFAVTPSAATQRVIGRAVASADNTGGGNGDLTIEAESGVFRYATASGGQAITAAHIGAACYAADDQTFSNAAASGRAPGATVYDVDDIGVWIKMG